MISRSLLRAKVSKQSHYSANTRHIQTRPFHVKRQRQSSVSARTLPSTQRLDAKLIKNIGAQPKATSEHLTNQVLQTKGLANSISTIGQTSIQRETFGNSVQLESIDGPPPRAIVLGPYSDPAIAQELYGDPAVPVKHAAGDHSVILIDRNRLLPNWEYLFPHNENEDELSPEEVSDISNEKEFSDLEEQWISEVVNHPVINMIFGSYELPAPVLNRVKQIDNKPETKGQFSLKKNNIKLADRIYNHKETHSIPGKSFKESDQEAFKGTLIHEIFHYIEHNAKRIIPDIPILQDLMHIMLYPEPAGFPKYAFGWFIHPDSKYILHFGLSHINPLYGGNPDYSINKHPDLVKAKEDKQWENSPMPESGESISREEDLVESFSLGLTSDRTREVLKTKYPMRYQLLTNYIRALKTLQKKADKE